MSPKTANSKKALKKSTSKDSIKSSESASSTKSDNIDIVSVSDIVSDTGISECSSKSSVSSKSADIHDHDYDKISDGGSTSRDSVQSLFDQFQGDRLSAMIGNMEQLMLIQNQKQGNGKGEGEGSEQEDSGASAASAVGTRGTFVDDFGNANQGAEDEDSPILTSCQNSNVDSGSVSKSATVALTQATQDQSQLQQTGGGVTDLEMGNMLQSGCKNKINAAKDGKKKDGKKKNFACIGAVTILVCVIFVTAVTILIMRCCGCLCQASTPETSSQADAVTSSTNVELDDAENQQVEGQGQVENGGTTKVEILPGTEKNGGTASPDSHQNSTKGKVKAVKNPKKSSPTKSKNGLKKSEDGTEINEANRNGTEASSSTPIGKNKNTTSKTTKQKNQTRQQKKQKHISKTKTQNVGLTSPDTPDSNSKQSSQNSKKKVQRKNKNAGQQQRQSIAKKSKKQENIDTESTKQKKHTNDIDADSAKSTASKNQQLQKKKLLGDGKEDKAPGLQGEGDEEVEEQSAIGKPDDKSEANSILEEDEKANQVTMLTSRQLEQLEEFFNTKFKLGLKFAPTSNDGEQSGKSHKAILGDLFKAIEEVEKSLAEGVKSFLLSEVEFEKSLKIKRV